MVRVPNRPPDRLILLALRAIEHARAEAQCGGVTPSLGLRLAFETILAAGVGQRWQVTSAWDEITRNERDPFRPDASSYCQTTALHGLLDNWHHALGIARTDYLALVKLDRLYAAEFLDSCAGSPDFASMCNRYKRGETDRIAALFGAALLRPFNDGPAIVHPRDPAPVVRLEAGAPVIEQMGWGFPVVLKGKKGLPLRPKPVNNARFDKLGGFWSRWACDPGARCLIPAVSFAEAVGKPGSMTCVWLTLPDQPLFAWAGLWTDDPDWGRVFTGVMTDNDPALAWVHDRMPVILDPSDWQTWLTAPLDELACFDRPWPAGLMKADNTNEPWWKPKGSL